MPSSHDQSGRRDFSLLWAASTLNELGSQVSAFAFPLVTYAVTGSAVCAAIVEASFLLGLWVALLPAGVLADRVNRRAIMRTASIAGALLYGSLAIAGGLGYLTAAHLAAVALLSGAASGVTGPAELSAIRSIVPPEDLVGALSRCQARQHVATLIGGPVGGVLVSAARPLPFAMDALTYSATWVALGRIRTDLSPQPRTAPSATIGRDVAEGLRFVLAWPYFRMQTAWSASVNVLVNGLFFVAILRMVQHGEQPLVIGLVATGTGAAGILGALVAPRLIEIHPHRPPRCSDRLGIRGRRGAHAHLERADRRPGLAVGCLGPQPRCQRQCNRVPDRTYPCAPTGPRPIRLSVRQPLDHVARPHRGRAAPDPPRRHTSPGCPRRPDSRGGTRPHAKPHVKGSAPTGRLAPGMPRAGLGDARPQPSPDRESVAYVGGGRSHRPNLQLEPRIGALVAPLTVAKLGRGCSGRSRTRAGLTSHQVANGPIWQACNTNTDAAHSLVTAIASATLTAGRCSIATPVTRAS